jgi:hypothetical protein
VTFCTAAGDERQVSGWLRGILLGALPMICRFSGYKAIDRVRRKKVRSVGPSDPIGNMPGP